MRKVNRMVPILRLIHHKRKVKAQVLEKESKEAKTEEKVLFLNEKLSVLELVIRLKRIIFKKLKIINLKAWSIKHSSSSWSEIPLYTTNRKKIRANLSLMSFR